MSRHDHSERAIGVLEIRESARRRLAFYVGDSINGLVRWLARDAIARGARRIQVRTEGSCVAFADNAPTEPHLFIGPGTTAASAYVASALAERMSVELNAGRRRRSIDLRRGVLQGSVRDHGPTESTGTRVSLIADPEIFGDQTFDRAVLGEFFAARCALHPGLVVELDGQRLCHPRGISGRVAELVGSTFLHPYPLRFTGYRDGVLVDIALQWSRRRERIILGFVDGEEAEVTHWLDDGLLEASRRQDISDPTVSELLRPGLAAMVAITHTSSLRDMSHDDHVGICRDITREGLLAHRRVIDRVITARGRSTLAG